MVREREKGNKGYSISIGGRQMVKINYHIRNGKAFAMKISQRIPKQVGVSLIAGCAQFTARFAIHLIFFYLDSLHMKNL